MLFNFQGPRTKMNHFCSQVILSNDLFIISRCFEFVKRFFQTFFEGRLAFRKTLKLFWSSQASVSLTAHL